MGTTYRRHLEAFFEIYSLQRNATELYHIAYSNDQQQRHQQFCYAWEAHWLPVVIHLCNVP